MTNRGYLADLTEEEKEKLITEYKTCSVERLDEMAKQLGYRSTKNFKDSMRVRLETKREVDAHSVDIEQERKNTKVELPPVNLIPFKTQRKRRKGDEEEAILHLTDGHAGKITNSFNDDIYRTRHGNLFENTMKIISLHRLMYPIRKLHIFMTGDNNQGENPHQGSKIGETSMGARDQVKKLSAPMMNDLIGSFRQQFDTVVVECIPGNHGHDKLAPETSSYDLLLYDMLEVGIGREKGITINVHDDWYTIVDIMGFHCFLFHGDGILCQQGVPFFALDKKLKSWYMQFGGFQYAFGGHFHKRHSDEISSKLEYHMASSMVSDDGWALKKLGISSNPSQNIYGMHPIQGMTWRYPITVDEKFLPEKKE